MSRAKRKGAAITPLARVRPPPTDGIRRNEILETAAELFGSSGFHTSLKEIADACGILPGSLYHHFESKEALIIELIERYQAELDGIAAQALDDLRRGEAGPIFDRIVALAEAIAACAIRHRAALLQTLYDPPASASDELIRSANRAPTAIEKAMLEILRAGRSKGYIRKGIDLGRFAEQICQSMLHTGVGVFHRTAGAHQIAAVKCRMLLEGLVVDMPPNEELERSKAFAAAQSTIAGWGREEDEDDRLSLLRATARAEFGRRGYESTTIRNIASAAGMSTGTVHRLVRSKDELLSSIMASFIKQVNASWDAVMASKANPIEKMDALIWVNINVLHHFRDEFKIQLSWLRQSPPTSSDIGQVTNSIRHIKALLAEGERSGDFRIAGASANIRAHCLLELSWVSENIVRGIGPRGTLTQARDTLLRGAAERA